MNQEAFESRNTGGSHAGKCLDVAPNHSSPGCPIHPSLAISNLALAFQSSHIDDFRGAVEWHVHQRCHPSRGGCASCRREPLPLCPAGFIDVDVRVHQPGKQNVVTKIVQSRNGRHFIPSTNTHNVLVLHQQGGGDDSLRCQHTGGTKCVCHTVFTFVARGGVEQVEGAFHTKPGIPAPCHCSGDRKCTRWNGRAVRRGDRARRPHRGRGRQLGY